LWWVPAGHHPSVDEALARLQLLDLDGPTQAAFGFKSRFPAPACPTISAGLDAHRHATIFTISTDRNAPEEWHLK